MIKFSRIDSPLGPLLVARDEDGLTHLFLPSGRHSSEPEPGWVEDATAFDDAREQLAEYFAGDRTTFDLPLHPAGTEFQRAAWQALAAIPYGETRSYGAQALVMGKPAAVRAVGHANGQNPISIIVPCHRVVGADGSLTGYGGGLDAKRWLLSHEASHAGLFAH